MIQHTFGLLVKRSSQCFLAVPDATDLAKTKADFFIVEKDLHAVLDTWRKAVQCRHIIIQNFAWALAYNFCAIPLAAFGFVPP